jgi:hypothetical protein
MQIHVCSTFRCHYRTSRRRAVVPEMGSSLEVQAFVARLYDLVRDDAGMVQKLNQALRQIYASA